MSSSSSAVRQRGPRVLRDAPAATGESTRRDTDDLLALDLGTDGLARLDPRRIDEAVAAGRTAGFEAGFEAGQIAGQQAVEAAHAERTAAHAAHLAAVVHACETAIASALAGVDAVAEAAARVTAGVAFSVAEAIVGRELVLAHSPGQDAVARALALAPEGVALTLRLHPDDAAALAVDDLPVGRAITVVSDPTVTPGDCMAETGWTRVDARIATALERVRTVLDGAG